VINYPKNLQDSLRQRISYLNKKRKAKWPPIVSNLQTLSCVLLQNRDLPLVQSDLYLEGIFLHGLNHVRTGVHHLLGRCSHLHPTQLMLEVDVHEMILAI